ncbi:MAG: cytosine permease [Deltaproteobacteria bacterium]|nr:cytosine permease [Deltaproteobacteria bacterium]
MPSPPHKSAPVKPGAKSSGDFGDPRLTNVELRPVASDQRRLTLTDVAVLWGAAAIGPTTYAAASLQVGWRTGLVIVCCTSVLVAILTQPLGRTAVRYGLGFVAVSRAAFGVQGARLPIVLRLLAGVAGVAFVSAELGGWTARLVIAALPIAGIGDGPWGRYGAWVGGAPYVVLAWWVAKGGMARVRRVSRVALTAAVLIAFALVVWAGIASRGFGDGLSRPGAFSWGEVWRGAALVALPLFANLASCSDWLRFRVANDAQRGGCRPWLWRLVPLCMAPVAVGLAFVGVLLMSSARAVGDTARASPIPDAASFGGVGAGGVAVLLCLALWLAAAPLFGLYSSALAVCGLWPRRVGFGRGLSVCLAGAVVLAPLFAATGVGGRVVVALLAAIAAVVGVLLADELVVRRGRVLLDELFTFGRHYGPWLGVSGGGLVAVAVGGVLHPEVVPLVQRGLTAAANQSPALRYLVGEGALGLGCFGSLAVAAVVYVAWAPAERKAIAACKRYWAGRRQGSPARLESSATTDVTNPHWMADKDD